MNKVKETKMIDKLKELIDDETLSTLLIAADL
jgi:hypothetical protein